MPIFLAMAIRILKPQSKRVTTLREQKSEHLSTVQAAWSVTKLEFENIVFNDIRSFRNMTTVLKYCAVTKGLCNVQYVVLLLQNNLK